MPTGNGRQTVAKLHAQLERLEQFTAMSAVTTRTAIAAQLGKSYQGERDIYTALGYPATLTYRQMLARYVRQDIAKAIVNIPVRSSWREPPTIEESEDDETAFEKAWGELAEERKIFHYLRRFDKLASLGHYAVLFLGFDDASTVDAFDKEVKRATALKYVQIYSEDSADIIDYDLDPKSERFGLPLHYTLKRTNEGTLALPTLRVHWSRVIHANEENLESDVYGTPRLESIYNRLQDLELICGSSAETFWRAAYPGIAFILDKDALPGEQGLDTMRDNIEEYMHDFKRYLRLVGIDVKQLSPAIADPRNPVDVQLDIISAASGIPRRILLGSERGELASSQDERNWAQRIEERRDEHCEPKILRPLIDRLIEVNVLPEPADGYSVKWPDLLSPSLKEKVDVGAAMAKAIKDYVDAAGADQVVPPDVFLERLGFSEEDIAKINEILEALEKEREREEKEAEEAAALEPPEPAIPGLEPEIPGLEPQAPPAVPAPQGV